MELSPNPIHKSGDRNFYCPHYGDCLDHAVEHRWNSWECSECAYKSMQESTSAVCTVPGPDPCYELPLEIYGQVRYRFD
jgi:hypothetical protein